MMGSYVEIGELKTCVRSKMRRATCAAIDISSNEIWGAQGEVATSLSP